MTQADLFARPDPNAPSRIGSAPGRTHRRDPESSHDAAERMRGPRADSQRARVLALLRGLPLSTGAELARATEDPRRWPSTPLACWQMRAVLDNLRAHGWAEVAMDASGEPAMIVCGVLRTRAQVWRSV